MIKLFLSAVCILAMSSFANNKKSEVVTKNEKTFILEEGKASDCAREARSRTFAIATFWDESPNDDLEFYLDIYDAIYLDCYLN